LSNIDQAHFQSSLLNLVVNARDAMPKGGEITISTENVTIDLTSARQLKEIRAGDYVMVTVQDNGKGMSPEVKARAIEPFFTTKDIGQGSGLGLSQVYGFIRQSKGQIEIKSEQGKGASVSLYLPKAAEAKILETYSDSFKDYCFQGTTLVVEDDTDAREIAVEAFESFGYTVFQARDGFEALSLLKQMTPVNLLFTDIIMPNGINGVMLAQDARKLHPKIRILLASGYPRETLRANEGLNESMAFIAKPYSFASLQEKLAALAPETLAFH
jgi:CheY-like chemotaxis protein